MKLQTLIPHKKNTKVLVNGTVYEIDGDRIIQDIPEDDAKKLLQNSNWVEFDSSLKSQPKPKSGIQLISSSGEVLSKEDETIVDPDTSAALAAADQFEAKKRGDANPPTEPEVEVPEDVELEAEEYPDPSMALDIEVLRKMADAYGVKYNKRTNKKTLVERLEDAMYE